MSDLHQNSIIQDIIAGCLVILTVAYASYTQIVLPATIRNLFNNDIFKIIVLSLIAIIAGNAKPHVALSIAILFVLTMHYIVKNELNETFGNIAKGKLCNNNEDCQQNLSCKKLGNNKFGKCE